MSECSHDAGGGRDGAAAPPARFTWEDTVICYLGFLLYLGVALYLRRLDFVFGDAVSRTAQAFAILYSRDPHLAAIGFAWNPLPTLVQVPVVALLHTLRLDVVAAGSLVSAAAGAATLVALNRAARRAGLPGRLRRPLLALYATNPMVVLYGANGMSEALFILLIVLIVANFMQWAQTRAAGPFVVLVAASALAAQTRYEAAALAVAVAVALALSCVPLAGLAGLTAAWQRAEGYLIAYLVAPAYSLASWLFFNWAIQGDPLFFLHSVYSNAAQTAEIRAGAVGYLHGALYTLPGALLFGLDRSLRLFPLAGAATAAAALLALARRDVALGGVVLMSAAIPLFEVAMVYLGESFGWLRFFIYGIPFTYLLLIALWRAAPGLRRGGGGGAVWGVVLVGLLASNLATWTAMDTPALGREENDITCRVFRHQCLPSAYALQGPREVSAYIERAVPPGNVLLDTYRGFPIPLVSAQPTRYVVTSDRDFERAVLHPYGAVRYLLVPNPHGFNGLGRNDRINRAYPSLWRRGSRWTRLVRAFPDTRDGWKLYRVVAAP